MSAWPDEAEHRKRRRRSGSSSSSSSSSSGAARGDGLLPPTRVAQKWGLKKKQQHEEQLSSQNKPSQNQTHSKASLFKFESGGFASHLWFNFNLNSGCWLGQQLIVIVTHYQTNGGATNGLAAPNVGGERATPCVLGNLRESTT